MGNIFKGDRLGCILLSLETINLLSINFGCIDDSYRLPLANLEVCLCQERSRIAIVCNIIGDSI